jgi:hypothetical protein
MKNVLLWIRIVLLLSISCLNVPASLCQTPGTGAVSGTVLDPASRVVVSAEVVATNEEMHVSRHVRTNAEGVYRVPLLAPGSYTITVTVAGFAPGTAEAVQVTASETTSVNVMLKVAGASSAVQVDSSVMAELESSTLGGLVDHAAIQALPLSSRNYTQILGLSPGVVADLPTPTVLGNGTQNVAANGATPTANNIQFNGVDANNLQENSAASSQNFEVGVAVPAPDTIEEFRVQTANFDAAYGRGAGANVDLISRGGTNHFHGSAWEFVRNNLFNANDFFSKLTGQPRADLKQNEFGAAAGGYLRKDRTFFFVAYQGITQVNGLGSLQTVELPLFTNSRTAAALGAQFCPENHLDSQGQPSLGYMTAAGGTQVACDGSNVNPVALAILNAKLPNGQLAIPNPQVALPPSTGTDPTDQLPLGLSTFSPPSHYREDQFTVNNDQVLTAKNTLAARFFYSRATVTLPFAPNGENLPGWDTDALNRNTDFVLTDTHVFNARLVNVARFGYIRFDGLVTQENPISAQDVGIGTPTGVAGPGSNLPFTTVGGFVFGDGGTPTDWSVTNSFHWQDTVALTHGMHNARFGVELKRHEVDENQPQQVDGNISASTIDDFLLGESAAENGSPLGLSNLSDSGAGAGIFRRDERYTDLAAFVQDDLKLTPRLTVNAGLRYEIFGAPIETHGRLANFDSNIAQMGAIPATGTFQGFLVPSNFQGTVPQGVVKDSFAGFYKTPLGDIAPRLGFVWQMSDRPVLVLRGGFGIYYDRHSGNVPEQTLGQAPFAFAQGESGPQNGAATLQSPYSPLLPQASSFPIFNPLVPGGFPFIEGTNPHLLDGKTYEYNLNVQYGLGRDYLLQLGYVGSQSTHRSGQVEFDQSLLASPQNPVNGETTNTSTNVVARMPIQGVSPGSLFTDSVFEANFNALEAGLTKRMRHGFQLQASYTWSKNLDEVNGEGGLDTFELELPTNNQHTLRESSYGPADDDRDQRFVLNFVWSAPKFATASRAVRSTLSGWQLSGVALIQSGAALSVFDGNAGSVYGLLGGEVRAEVAPGVQRMTKGSLYSRVVSGPYLNANAFMRAPEVANGVTIADEDFGNSGVGIVRGPGQHSLDLAVERQFRLFANKNLVLRAESFNLTNTPQFGNPNTSLGYGNPLLPAVASPSFGLITGEQGGPHPRIIQLAAKFLF